MLDWLARIKRADYRAWHRGTREMDLLLGRFATKKLTPLAPLADEAGEAGEADEKWLRLFEDLLEEEDNHIYDWLMDKDYQGRYLAMIEEIRQFHP